jgi:hypothetical protein
MRARRHIFQPMVEPIESRALLSGGLAVASSAHSMVRHHHPVTVPLNGALRGQYNTLAVSPDAGTSYLFSGTSFVRGFGLASGVGEIVTPGPGVEGHAQGNLALLSARGALRFKLTALEPQTGPQNLASEYSYQITSASGVFQGAKGGGGSATLTLIQGPRNHFGYPLILQRFILSLKSDSLAT